MNMCNENIIRRVGICGLGQMGTAAAVCYKRAGFETILWDKNRDQLDSVEGRLASLEEWMDDRLGPTTHAGGKYSLARALSDLDERADLVMDCIVEDFDEKVTLLASLKTAIQREAILITTTSGLSITEMGSSSGTGQILAGTHFWNPPHLMPLVEVIRGRETRDSVLDRVCEMMVTIGKIPVRVEQDVPGFIGNRLLHALWREALYLVQEGIAKPQDIDLVARLTFGLRMPAVGPLENMDLVGLDLIEKIHAYLLVDLSNDAKPLPVVEEKVSEGNLGMKTGQGFYEWSEQQKCKLIEKRDRQIVHQLEFLKQLEDR
jgi:3-hydroxybutyryl-CoA dehydrogenase